VSVSPYSGRCYAASVPIQVGPAARREGGPMGLIVILAVLTALAALACLGVALGTVVGVGTDAVIGTADDWHEALIDLITLDEDD